MFLAGFILRVLNPGRTGWRPLIYQKSITREIKRRSLQRRLK